MRSAIGPLAALLLLLGACAPVVREDAPRPVVSVINAPGEERASQEPAELVQQLVLATPGCCSFSFMRSPPLRFRETHTNVFGHRAVPGAASIARNLTSEVVVLVGSPRFERQVRELRGGAAEVTGSVQLRAVVVDARSEEVLAVLPSLTVHGSRFVRDAGELPAAARDPLMRELIEEAAEDVAPHLAAVLEEVAAGFG